MTEVTLEHINLTVADPKATAAKLSALFGWRIRWEGEAKDGGYSIHVGGDASYLALYAPAPDAIPPQSGAVTSKTGASYKTTGGLNHIAVTVSDIDEMERTVVANGYTPRAHGDYEPGRRFYFHNEDGIEFEIVSYE